MTEQISNKPTVLAGVGKFLQLFFLSYFFFYMFPFPIGDIPIVNLLFNFYDSAFELITIWLGKAVFHFDKIEHIKMTGSGDTTFDYVKILTNVLLALVFAVIIFIVTAKKNNYKVFASVVFTYARYYLAIYLLIYGFAKFYNGQFVSPDVDILEQSIGDTSPMGLMWTFMGFSKAYTVFGGICEVVAGMFLFFRRTTVLGGLISFMVMTNVAIMNFAYDIPVKLFSTHLVLISIFIISPNLFNLFQFFVFNKPVALKIDTVVLQNKWLRYGRIAFKSLMIMGLPAFLLFAELSYMEEKPTHNLNAAYITKEFIKNKDTLSNIKNDTTRWSKLFITDYYTKIVFANNKKMYFTTKVNTSSKTINLTSYNDTTAVYKLKYHFIDKKTFAISGKFRADSISATFQVKRKKDYELIKRGFHWINEYPHNR